MSLTLFPFKKKLVLCYIITTFLISPEKSRQATKKCTELSGSVYKTTGHLLRQSHSGHPGLVSFYSGINNKGETTVLVGLPLISAASVLSLATDTGNCNHFMTFVFEWKLLDGVKAFQIDHRWRLPVDSTWTQLIGKCRLDLSFVIQQCVSRRKKTDTVGPNNLSSSDISKGIFDHFLNESDTIHSTSYKPFKKLKIRIFYRTKG